MLMKSQRITPKDAKFCAQFDEIDATHINTRGYKIRIEDAKNAIKRFVAEHSPTDYYIGVSWGKDSVVLLDLFLHEEPRLTAVFFWNVEKIPQETIDVRDQFLRTHEPFCYIEKMYATPRGTPFKGEFKRFLPEFKRKYGIHVTGIRRDESAVRDMRYVMHGYESRWSFAPLSNLKCQDIFSYIYEHDLPLHASYRMTGEGSFDRYRIRVAAIGNPRGRGVGRLAWEKRFYGDIINRCEALEICGGDSD